MLAERGLARLLALDPAEDVVALGLVGPAELAGGEEPLLRRGDAGPLVLGREAVLGERHALGRAPGQGEREREEQKLESAGRRHGRPLASTQTARRPRLPWRSTVRRGPGAGAPSQSGGLGAGFARLPAVVSCRMLRRLSLRLATEGAAPRPTVDAIRKRLGGRASTEPGAGEVVSLGAVADRMGVVLFVRGEQLDVWFSGDRVQRVRRADTRPGRRGLAARAGRHRLRRPRLRRALRGAAGRLPPRGVPGRGRAGGEVPLRRARGAGGRELAGGSGFRRFPPD